MVTTEINVHKSHHRDTAKRLLVYYFGLVARDEVAPLDPDNIAEIELIVDAICDACAEEAKHAT